MKPPRASLTFVTTPPACHDFKTILAQHLVLTGYCKEMNYTVQVSRGIEGTETKKLTWTTTAAAATTTTPATCSLKPAPTSPSSSGRVKAAAPATVEAPAASPVEAPAASTLEATAAATLEATTWWSASFIKAGLEAAGTVAILETWASSATIVPLVATSMTLVAIVSLVATSPTLVATTIMPIEASAAVCHVGWPAVQHTEVS